MKTHAGNVSMLKIIGDWWLSPLPRGRVAALRTLVYSFVLVDLFLLRPWVSWHANVPTELYHPLFVARFLPEPVPTFIVVRFVQAALAVAAVLALVKIWPRLTGYLVAVLYLEWSIIAFSYGKVDHDSVAFLVALAVLPSAGPAAWGDRERTERAGWAIRCIQVAVVVTYFAAVFAKFRLGGVNWITGSTFMRAVLRRGTSLAAPMVNHPGVLKLGQAGLVLFEALSPLLLRRDRVGKLMLTAAFLFHLVTFAAVKIMFWPHVLCLLSFLPLERVALNRMTFVNRGVRWDRG